MKILFLNNSGGGFAVEVTCVESVRNVPPSASLSASRTSRSHCLLTRSRPRDWSGPAYCPQTRTYTMGRPLNRANI